MLGANSSSTPMTWRLLNQYLGLKLSLWIDVQPLLDGCPITWAWKIFKLHPYERVGLICTQDILISAAPKSRYYSQGALVSTLAKPVSFYLFFISFAALPLRRILTPSITFVESYFGATSSGRWYFQVSGALTSRLLHPTHSFFFSFCFKRLGLCYWNANTTLLLK